MADSQADNNTCVVCFKNVSYYSIGECDHPVCFECSTRMRVLCLQNECPICRQDLARVVFTDSVLPYKELRNRVFTDRLFERQFKIAFCSQEIKNAYEELLENRCRLCSKLAPFRTFTMLSDHMRKVHERYFCDLCVKHLKIFTNERKCYTRQELAHHRRKGDLDDTSHRGHPLCEFCEERFMDADELYRHLRKEHLFCHLCDADGKNLYYASHVALAHHFRTDHYLCEEGECAGQHLIAVFRSEIDLKAHKATVHGRNMPRGAARQARTLELQFNITPHPQAQRGAPRDREREMERSISPPPPVQHAPRIDTRSDEQFPRLSAAPQTPNLVLGAGHKAYRGGDGLARNDRNFPALGNDSGPAPAPAPTSSQRAPPVAATILRNSKPSMSIQLHSQPTSASNFRLTQASGNRVSIPARRPLSDDDFPSLSARDDHPSVGAASHQPPKVAMINSQEMEALKKNTSNSQPKKAPLSGEAFPALSGGGAPAAPPQWITVSKQKDKPRPRAEPPREPAFHPVADFPGLPANTKHKPKKAPPAQPVRPQPQPQPVHTPAANSDAKLSKKEKKKQNGARKENVYDIDLTLVNGIEDLKYVDPNALAASANTPTQHRNIKTVDSVTVNDKERNGGNGDFSLAAKEFPSLSKSNNVVPVNNFAVPMKAVLQQTKRRCRTGYRRASKRGRHATG
ncbi:E3 ubiquitin-protein ligase ZNF598 isoform X1 [Leguminivora glycinivorella]|uniref:E3 ubiquitin-protein ligase ZNF598 isoform X1 n=1 Tax=Leguminivora glycinivorella TaxID=1035111 RepID=UPI00200D65E5|nr:E3 ubiquitin-protein ligase ZNF598 isoform X1 [Leguminivora glycinivorella]XP_047995702.1 E3 ubiquitin-protein ligase ZNF598 isoform X1 [Leguminivora glycinivorella]